MYHYVEKVTASIEEAKEKIEHFITEDSLVFPIFTDLHTEDIDHEYMKRLIPVLEIITDNSVLTVKLLHSFK